MKQNCKAVVEDLELGGIINLEKIPVKELKFAEKQVCKMCGMVFNTKESLMEHFVLYAHSKQHEKKIGELELILDEPQNKVTKGSTVKFTGKLRKDGKGIANTQIKIFDKDRSFMKDDLMASGTTRDDGNFEIDWVAKEMDWFDYTVEVYAKSEKDTKQTISKIFTVTVK